MPEHLSQEIIDSIIDLSRDNPEVLRNCSLVSKSWVARARKYLFERIKFEDSSKLEKWKKTFQDPERSPAYHVRYLTVCCPRKVTAEDGEGDGWIRSFTNLKRLEIYDEQKQAIHAGSEHVFTHFRKFLPTVESLSVNFSYALVSQVLGLVCSFPSLKDLEICGDNLYDDINSGTAFTFSPEFTGTLVLNCAPRDVTHRLLGLPGGLRFRQIEWNSHYNEERRHEGMKELVEGCSSTLGIMKIDFGGYPLAPQTPSLDLSEATKLKGVTFLSDITPNAEWITGMLNTIGPAHVDLRAILIRVCFSSSISDVGIRRAVEAGTYRPLMDLDDTLVRLSKSDGTSRTVSCCAICPEEEKPGEARKWVERLLPEMAKKGPIRIISDSEEPLFIEQTFGK